MNMMVPGHEVAGEWYVQTFLGGTAVLGHQSILTYNTAAATGDSIWVDDAGHIWPFKGKLAANAGAASFSGMFDNEQVDPVYDTLDIIRDASVDPIDSLEFVEWHTVTISDGKVIPDAGKSKTGVVVDSIYFKAVFSDDASSEYEIAGHRRTGFEEDDY